VADLQQAWAGVEAAWRSLPPGLQAMAEGGAPLEGEQPLNGAAQHPGMDGGVEPSMDADQQQPGQQAESREQPGQQQGQSRENGGADQQLEGQLEAQGSGHLGQQQKQDEQQAELAFGEEVLEAAGAWSAAQAAGSPGRRAPADATSLLALLDRAPLLLEAMAADDFPRLLEWSEGLCGLTLLPLGCAAESLLAACAGAW
jgi:hypothetical protein